MKAAEYRRMFEAEEAQWWYAGQRAITARLRDRKRGLESARLYMIAWGWSFAAVLGIGALMIFLWIVWAFM